MSLVQNIYEFHIIIVIYSTKRGHGPKKLSVRILQLQKSLLRDYYQSEVVVATSEYHIAHVATHL